MKKLCSSCGYKCYEYLKAEAERVKMYTWRNVKLVGGSTIIILGKATSCSSAMGNVKRWLGFAGLSVISFGPVESV